MSNQNTKPRKTEARTSSKRKEGNDLSNGGFNSRRTRGSSDIYQKVTDLIIEKPEQGAVPWRQPWHVPGLPANYLAKRPYKGINRWALLSCDHQYPYYLTFKQVQKLGGKVVKGAKPIPICYWNFEFRDRKAEKALAENRIGEYELNLVGKSVFLKELLCFHGTD